MMAVHSIGAAVAAAGTTEAAMSSKNEADYATMLCCASCGKAEVDDVKLKKCACGLVKYCSIACQKDHRSKHKRPCKKRLVELRDEILFKQPDSIYLGDCPICCLPLAMDPSESIMMPCCSKLICKGCEYANKKREKEAGLLHRCAFCRESMIFSKENALKRLMERVKKNDPVAMTEMGKKHYNEGDYETAFEYYIKAAELGSADAHYQLSCMYHEGCGVEEDMKKAFYHFEEAAIGGHPIARHNLGVEEGNNGRFERAKKHFIIAANLGLHESLECIRELYANGHASKEDYSDALRAYQASLGATKSAQRERVEEDGIVMYF